MSPAPEPPEKTTPRSAPGPMELADALRDELSQVYRRLREQSHLGDFSLSQINAILRLEREGPMTVSQLAQAEGMRAQSMSTTVAGLKAQGMIDAAPDPSDGRVSLLSLTEACRAALDASRRAKRDWLGHAIQTRLSEAERARLAEAITLLGRLSAD